MNFTEADLNKYAAPLSETEIQKCKNAIEMVRDALKPLGFSDDGNEIKAMYEDTLAYSLEMRNYSNNRCVKLFIQGSYANNTNVRTHSDVDIAVVEENVFRTHYRDSQSDSNYGFVPAESRQNSFKDEVQIWLQNKFEHDVERKNKSIKVHGNTYRKDADTVPGMRYRDYSHDYQNDKKNFMGGIVIFPDDNSGIIINYPEQHIYNGKQKNKETHYHYKKMVRIMKKMRYLMDEYGYGEAKEISSFALESLLWNIPSMFYVEYGGYRKVFMFQSLINCIKRHKNDWSSYFEANGIKPLFPSIDDINKMDKFIDKLSQFYIFD